MHEITALQIAEQIQMFIGKNGMPLNAGIKIKIKQHIVHIGKFGIFKNEKTNESFFILEPCEKCMSDKIDRLTDKLLNNEIDSLIDKLLNNAKTGGN